MIRSRRKIHLTLHKTDKTKEIEHHHLTIWLLSVILQVKMLPFLLRRINPAVFVNQVFISHSSLIVCKQTKELNYANLILCKLQKL